MPHASLPTVLKVIGAITAASGRSRLLGVPTARCSERTASPAAAASSASSTQLPAEGVVITWTRQPAPASLATISGALTASGAPQTTTVQRLVTDLFQQASSLREQVQGHRLTAGPAREH